MSYQASKKNTGTVRTHRLGLYFTDAEWTVFERLARADEHKSVHDWILQEVLKAGRIAAEEHRIPWPTEDR